MKRKNDVEVKMAKKLAGGWHKATGIDWEELYSEAIVGMWEARKTFRLDRGTALTSWQYCCANYRLKTFCANYETSLGEKMESAEYRSDDGDFVEIISSLPENARMVCKVILETPNEFAGIMPKIARGKVVKTMRDLGWSWGDIWETFRIIKNALNSK